MRLLELLGNPANDNGSGRVGELLELSKMLVDGTARAGALERRADEHRAIDGRGDGN
jgi:hypothetical protein